MSYHCSFYLKSRSERKHRQFRKLLQVLNTGTITDPEFAAAVHRIDAKNGGKALKSFLKSAAQHDYPMEGPVRSRQGFLTFSFTFAGGDEQATKKLMAFLAKLQASLNLRAFLWSDGADVFLKLERGKVVQKTHREPFASLKRDRAAMAKTGPYRWWHSGLPKRVWHGTLDKNFEKDHAESQDFDRQQESDLLASGFGALLDSLSAKKKVDINPMLLSLQEDSVLGVPFDSWLANRMFGKQKAFEHSSGLVRVSAGLKPMTAGVEISVSREGQASKIVAFEWDNVRSHLAALSLDLVHHQKMDHFETWVWLNGAVAVSLKIQRGYVDFQFHRPTTRFLSGPIRKLQEWFYLGSNSGALKFSPAFIQLVEERIEREKSSLDDYYLWKTDIALRKSEENWQRFLDEGIARDELACIFRKGIVLTNSKDKKLFDQGMVLLKEATARKFPNAKSQLRDRSKWPIAQS